MAAAFGLLRLSPRDFWSMTPREMERAMSVLAAGERVRRTWRAGGDDDEFPTLAGPSFGPNP